MPSLDQPLTKNFTLREMLISQEATRNGMTEQFEPSPEIIANLTSLCKNILQPLRERLRVGISVSSGYRSPRVNAGIGGAKNSQHLEGKAADIAASGKPVEWLFQKLRESGLPFDQLIQEFDSWVHVSYDPARNRHQVFRATKDTNGKTVYTPVT